MTDKDIMRVPTVRPQLRYHGEYPFDDWNGIWTMVMPIPPIAAYEIYKDAVRASMRLGQTDDNYVVDQDVFVEQFLNKGFRIVDQREDMVRAIMRVEETEPAGIKFVLIEAFDAQFLEQYYSKHATDKEKLAPFKKAAYPHTHMHEGLWLSLVVENDLRGKGEA